MKMNDFNLPSLEEEGMDIYTLIDCPCCGAKTYNMHWICPNCAWEFDGVIAEDEYSSANKATLIDYRKIRGIC